jgi:predicted dehydrogenase
MKCLVVGYGSIGARHTRLLVDLGCEVAVVSERDIDFKRRYRSLTQAVQQFQPEYLVIANKTQEHLSSLLELKTLNYQGRVLVEKPIFNKTESIDCSDFKKIAVAYNLRFHPVIVRLKDLIDEVDVLESMQVYAGQYISQ